MSDEALAGFVTETAEGFGVAGAAAGVWQGGREVFASHGVTSAENPLPVTPDTLFLIASVTKTFTATAVMRLVADGKVALDAPVRRYVPELVLADERAADQITVLNLLNHTSGLDWGVIGDFGEGDDALARYVSRLAGLKLIAPPGTRPSYSQAGFNLAGRIVEKVTGLTYEKAVASLVFSPAGLPGSFFDRDDVMTRRFAVGHNRGEDGTLSIGRLWRRSRGDNPGGGIASSAADQLRWAAFHLGDGHVNGSGRVLPAEVLTQMMEPTVTLRGSALGDAIGLGWFVRELDGVRAVGHGGTANGQFAELLMVPAHDFAVVSLANAGPDGLAFNQAVVRWALQTYLGLTDRGSTRLPYDETRRPWSPRRDQDAVMTSAIGADGGRRWLGALMRPEIMGIDLGGRLLHHLARDPGR
jgi:CubicO group peptidase (beta-lactamase class C family)